MLRNIKLEIEYDGTNYCGWQVQNGRRALKRSIQEVIESTLNKILQENVKIICSGRTDAGVHARFQIANFTTGSSISALRLQGALNALLPADIVVAGVKDMPPGFHSRFGALSKTYRYTILNRAHRPALMRHSVYWCPYPLDIRLMRSEAKVLIGRHDFAAFKTTSAKKGSSVRTIRKIRIAGDAGSIYIDIEADGFLYAMVRTIVGTLLEIGRGKLAKGALAGILKSRDRKQAGPTAPACGLCLMTVRYGRRAAGIDVKKKC